MKSIDCASIHASVFQPRGNNQTYEASIGLNVRLHCLQYGQYFELKEKCLRCGYLLSFTTGEK